MCKRFTLDLLPRAAESPQDKRLVVNLEQSVLAATMSPPSRPTGRTLVGLFTDCFTCPAHFPAKASWGTGFSRHWGSTITHCSFRKLRERMGKNIPRGPFPKRFVKCMRAQKPSAIASICFENFCRMVGHWPKNTSGSQSERWTWNPTYLRNNINVFRVIT